MGIILLIIAVLAFDTVLCLVEIPKMLKKRQYKELYTYSILLVLGTVLAILKSLDMEIPNPTKFTEWVYSPFSEIMKNIVK